jgi:hypothetical protein
MELEETLCWLVLDEDSNIVPAQALAALKAEAAELSTNLVTLIKQAKGDQSSNPGD